MITQQQAGIFIFTVGVVSFLLVAAGGFAARVQRRAWGLTMVMVGAALGMVAVMWGVYNAVTDRLGLDSVLNLLVNLALFLVVGGLCGALWAGVTEAVRRQSEKAEGAEEDVRGKGGV